MQLQLKPANKLTYKLRLTPQMRLAISLLQMPLVKLQDYVKQQIDENPLLEIENKEIPPGEVEFDFNYSSNEDEEEKQNYRENLISKPTTLAEHLLNQLHLFVNSDEEGKIGEVIINNIDDNGYLKSSIEEIEKLCKADVTSCKKVLSLIQTFDPIGVGARDLRECLLLQIKAKGQENSLAGQIINKYLPFLEKKRFEFIAKKLSAKGARLPDGQGSASGGKVSVERIKEAIKGIASLEPKPGRSFNTERAVRLIPDAIVKRNNDKYEVVLNDWELPRLSISPKYKRMLKQKDIAEDTKVYLGEKVKQAKFLIDAINKRKETIRKVTEAIVYIQKDFLDNGMQNLKPMTLSQIAHLVDKHKSTV
ncbi:MAG: RNA polymerase factor sigma-54, partial [Candidatus Omnitrophica bacterium]|nr:RNA polymerase factor sigma-54 [Candidatus Omnitrophota bacterium]